MHGQMQGWIYSVGIIEWQGGRFRTEHAKEMQDAGEDFMRQGGVRVGVGVLPHRGVICRLDK